MGEGSFSGTFLTCLPETQIASALTLSVVTRSHLKTGVITGSMETKSQEKERAGRGNKHRMPEGCSEKRPNEQTSLRGGNQETGRRMKVREEGRGEGLLGFSL